ncbi:MAG: DNA-directed RNA polymerase subunit omega [Clostridia bacterium]|nr:DNA-directed RNA polymerase subunit omega [Clostridia bacterium]
MMIKPSIEELTHGGEINRYTLVIATAKCARQVTDEYCRQRERAERLIANKETDKPLSALIDTDIRDKKAVENAVERIAAGQYTIDKPYLG